ncbi:tRNA (adenine(22)-N(1))-methyltransferase [Desulfallas thermosapovorans]|uniref:tRNA (Adenine22-N1)-methyltransferase n=1 Tax=Desulfallas thermosapovorans DSM 6562 TaxID=1121431 RepID=A0A5S4ZYU7_9FIRM|nr:class I SAM-dependent methyltransferase [Desulfallas thermosapovorans]TYO97311.1 tRNA (adenine22-N1)-methyltransferase [Desulfallas thermosapovorans DSM 6562]
MELSKRLAAVARHVPVGAAVADIGTDHAYLPVYLVRQGISARVVAGDINYGPFEGALLTVRDSGLEKYIDLRMGDGLQILKPGEVNVLVVAGMGGKTVCDIFEQGRSVLQQVRRLIIQPMRDIPEVRRWLTGNGWRLVDEDMVTEDGHYYVIIVAEPGMERPADSFVLEVGPRLLEKKDPVLKEFLKRRIIEINTILQEIKRARSVGANNRAKVLRQEARKIREVLESW